MVISFIGMLILFFFSLNLNSQLPTIKKVPLSQDAYNAVPNTKGAPMIGRKKKLSAVEVKALRIPRTKGGSPVKKIVSFQNKENPRGYSLMKSDNFYEFYEKEDGQNTVPQNIEHVVSSENSVEKKEAETLPDVSVSSILQKAEKAPPAPKKKVSTKQSLQNNKKEAPKKASEEGFLDKMSAFFAKTKRQISRAINEETAPSSK